jgi:hypothetical protein
MITKFYPFVERKLRAQELICMPCDRLRNGAISVYIETGVRDIFFPCGAATNLSLEPIFTGTDFQTDFQNRFSSLRLLAPNAANQPCGFLHRLNLLCSKLLNLW